MSLSSLTILLLIVYSLLLLNVGILQVVHSIMHITKNSIHHHEYDDYHSASDHDVIAIPDSPSFSDAESSSMLTCYFLFFQDSIILSDPVATSPAQILENPWHHPSFHSVPAVPPPIS